MEPTEIDNPVIKTDDPEMDALFAAAQKADAGEEPDGVAQSSAQPESADRAADEAVETDSGPEVKKTDNSEASLEPARDELGRFTRSDGTKSEPNEKIAEPKLDSAYDKAKKERERQHNLLKNFEADKQRERALLQAERQQLEKDRAELEARRNGKTQPGEFNSSAYENAAADFERQAEQDQHNGDTESAAGNYALAAKARRAAHEVRQSETAQSVQQQKGGFEQTWRNEMESTIREVPDLANPDTPLAKQMIELLKQEQIFNYIPDGFRKAYGVARLQMEAKEASELREKNKQLTAELDRYQKLTSVSGSSPTRHGEGKSFDSMSTDEQLAVLERRTREFDGMAAA